MATALLLIIAILCSLRMGANSLSTNKDIIISIVVDACLIAASIALYVRIP